MKVIHNQSIIVSVLFVACATVPLQNIDAASKFASHAKWLKRGILVGTGYALSKEYNHIELQKNLNNPNTFKLEDAVITNFSQVREKLQYRAKQCGISQPLLVTSTLKSYGYGSTNLSINGPSIVSIPIYEIDDPNMFAITHELGHIANNDGTPQKRMLKTTLKIVLYIYCSSLYKWKSIHKLLPFIIGQTAILAGTTLGIKTIEIIHKRRQEHKADQFAIAHCNAQEIFDGIQLFKHMKNHADQIIKDTLPPEYSELTIQENLPQKTPENTTIHHHFAKFLFAHRYSLLDPSHPHIDKRIALLTQKAHEKAIQENNKDIISKTKKMLDELEHEKK